MVPEALMSMGYRSVDDRPGMWAKQIGFALFVWHEDLLTLRGVDDLGPTIFDSFTCLADDEISIAGAEAAIRFEKSRIPRGQTCAFFSVADRRLAIENLIYGK